MRNVRSQNLLANLQYHSFIAFMGFSKRVSNIKRSRCLFQCLQKTKFYNKNEKKKHCFPEYKKKKTYICKIGQKVAHFGSFFRCHCSQKSKYVFFEKRALDRYEMKVLSLLVTKIKKLIFSSI